MSNIANANPLDAGSDANSVETAAASFTEMLADEGRSPRRERAEARSRQSEPKSSEDEDDGAPGPDDDDDTGHDPEADPFLTSDDPEEGEEGEDGEDEGDEEDTDEDDGEDDEEDDGEIDFDREIPVTINGEVQNVKIADLVAGYSMEADYRQKTEQLSVERQELEEFAVETVAQRQRYDTQLQDFIDTTAALMPTQQEWDALKAANLPAYVATREQWDKVEGKIAEAKAERERVAAEAQAQELQRYNDYVKEQNAELVKAVPHLRNPKKAAGFRNLIFAYGKKMGYSDAELKGSAVDHRDVLTLYKAARYEEIMESRKSGQRPAKKAPRETTPSSQVRSVGKRAGKSRSLREADRRAARTGSVDDAALAFDAMLKS